MDNENTKGLDINAVKTLHIIVTAKNRQAAPISVSEWYGHIPGTSHP